MNSSTQNPGTLADSSTLAAGQKLAGVYVLRKELPSGGPVAIWLAQDQALDREVSLHFLPMSVRADSRAMSELRQEIKRNRQLIHANIVRVYDLIEESDWAAVSMDAFEAESLSSILARREGGFFEPADVKVWISQLCQTLEDVHRIQLVHRNLAPSNLWIDAGGKLLVSSFGIGRTIADGLSRAQEKGTPDVQIATMSPQQLDGETVAKTDDIYALGVTIYQLLSGEVPFAGADVVAQIRKSVPGSMMEQRAKAGRRGGTILPTWERAVAACMAKLPADRPQTALEVATKLGLGKLGATGAAAPAVAAPAPAPAPPAAAPAMPALALGKESSTPLAPADRRKDTIRVERKSSDKGVREGGSALAAVPSPEGVAPSPNAAPAPSPNAAVESSSNRKAEPASKKGARAPDKGKEKVEDAFPSPYPKRTGVPVTALAFVAVIVGAGAVMYFANQPKGDPLAGSPGTGAPSGMVPSPGLARVNNPSVVNAVPTVDDRTSAPSGGAPVRAVVAPPKPRPVTMTEAPPAVAERTPGVTPAEETAATLLAQNDARRRNATPAASPTPVRVIPGPPSQSPGTLPVNSAAAGAGDSSLAAKNAELERARQVADAAERAAQEAKAKQVQADAVLAEAQKALDAKMKVAGPAMKAAEELATQRKQREEAKGTADQALATARQALEEKSRQAEEARKALTDFDTQNKEKLSGRDKATTEMAALQQAVADRQKAAADAAKAAADSDSARQTGLAALKQREEEAAQARLAVEKAAADSARRMAEARAGQKAEIDKKINDMKREFEERLKALEAMKSDDGAVVAPPPAVPANPPGASVTPKPVEASSPPQPTADAVPLGEPLPTLAMNVAPAIPVPALTPLDRTSPPVKPSEPPPAGTVENTLGMRFAPVGDLFFSVWPTRVKDFDVFAKDINLKSNAWKGPGFKQDPDHPVVNVTWVESIGFCKWLTDRERKKGLLPAGQAYRLPTDLEWSVAVGLPEEAGKTPEDRDMGAPDVFPWGTQWPPPPNVGNYTGEETGSDVAIKGYDDGFAWTSPVGSFPANRYGLYDMGGNVWQWCMDAWNTDSKARVLRGASWYNGALKLSLLSSCRVHANPDSSTDNYGFRIVRAADSGRSRR